MAVKDLMAAGKLKGTIQFYGTPAEEAVGGKIYMVRDGVFKDLDVCLTWHPGDGDPGRRRRLPGHHRLHRRVRRQDRPRRGRSVERPQRRGRAGVLHHAASTACASSSSPRCACTTRSSSGGDVPNVVPAYAKLWCWLRDSKGAGVEQLLARVRKIAEGAALMAEAEAKITVQGGRLGDAGQHGRGQGHARQHDVARPGRLHARGAGVRQGDPAGHGRRAQGPRRGRSRPWRAPKPDPDGGSTDVGDVSWVVPMLRPERHRRRPLDAPWHAWPTVACAGMSIGHKGLVYAAKAHGRDHGRPLRGRQAPPGGAGRVQGEDQGHRLQALHPRRAAAAAEALTRGRGRVHRPADPRVRLSARQDVMHRVDDDGLRLFGRATSTSTFCVVLPTSRARPVSRTRLCRKVR
ncbi:MAG: peptidase dimerization domain-containing protein [Marinilabiliales bacterium]|nr:peptidase dimerization domain-containing protein [Marinilabiliales bacterium]